MEIIIALVTIVVVVALIYFNRSAKSPDINNDGKVDLADAKAAVENTVTGLAAAADVNRDGVVDAADVKAVAEKPRQRSRKQPQKLDQQLRKQRLAVADQRPSDLFMLFIQLERGQVLRF